MHSSTAGPSGLPMLARVAVKVLALGLVLAGVLVVSLSPLFVH